MLRAAANASARRDALDVVIGEVTTTDGSCGALGSFRGAPSSSLSVTGRMSVGVVP